MPVFLYTITKSWFSDKILRKDLSNKPSYVSFEAKKGKIRVGKGSTHTHIHTQNSYVQNHSCVEIESVLENFVLRQHKFLLFPTQAFVE
jgi:hypothetical protein